MNLSLEQNNYLYVPNFLTTQEADELAQWMFEQERLGVLQEDPRSNFNLFGLAIRNGLPFVKFLVKKIPEVSRLCGEEVLPTYVYSIIYKNKAELMRHVDKDACDISLTINLQKDTNWPICIKKPNGEEVCLELNAGDAMMYLGCDAEHWRHNKFTGQNFIQTFMHYVRADGPRAYAYFDKEQK
jgi:hypothetical protein